MKKVINGTVYNTKSALGIGSYGNGFPFNDSSYVYEELYLKRSGEYFLFGKGGASTRWGQSVGRNSRIDGQGIIPLTKAQALAWAEKSDMDTDDIINEFNLLED